MQAISKKSHVNSCAVVR